MRTQYLLADARILRAMDAVRQEDRHLDQIGDRHPRGTELRFDIAPCQSALVGEAIGDMTVFICGTCPLTNSNRAGASIKWACA